MKHTLWSIAHWTINPIVLQIYKVDLNHAQLRKLRAETG